MSTGASVEDRPLAAEAGDDRSSSCEARKWTDVARPSPLAESSSASLSMNCRRNQPSSQRLGSSRSAWPAGRRTCSQSERRHRCCSLHMSRPTAPPWPASTSKSCLGTRDETATWRESTTNGTDRFCDSSYSRRAPAMSTELLVASESGCSSYGRGRSAFISGSEVCRTGGGGVQLEAGWIRQPRTERAPAAPPWDAGSSAARALAASSISRLVPFAPARLRSAPPMCTTRVVRSRNKVV
mmetsp:Transcript_1359/g.4325  ORF Transcript_1359/g.4325 Transcript_1359/m.4325 type:complete len:240 (+) Transcript_1359:1104-1823(+)|eukprot:scaffold4297_cov103-Isochrysis_galbana.AAC.5